MSRFLSIIPTLDRILIQKIKPPTQTIGGIVLPESAQKAPINAGKVLKVGPGMFDRNGAVIPINLKEGDEVLLGEYGGTSVNLNDEELWLYREEDILGVLTK